MNVRITITSDRPVGDEPAGGEFMTVWPGVDEVHVQTGDMTHEGRVFNASVFRAHPDVYSILKLERRASTKVVIEAVG